MQNIQPICKKQFLFSNKVSALLGICLYGLIIAAICVISRRISYKCVKRSIMLLSIAGIFYLFFVSCHYCFSTGWDCGTILDNAIYLYENRPDKLNNYYYSNYQNNILLTFFYSILYKLADALCIKNGYFLILFVQSVIYSLSGYLIYKTADIYFGEKHHMYSSAVWIIYMLIIGHSPWIVIPYSDSAGLIFVTSCAYCYFKANSNVHKRINLFIMTLLSVLGYFIKPQIFVFAIAFSIVTLIAEYKSIIANPKNAAKTAVFITAAVLTAISAVFTITKVCHFKIDKEERLGMPHFIMMGLNDESHGIYNPNDILYSQSYHNNKERNTANLLEAKRRVQNFGFCGMLNLAIHKTLINYNDGTFAWYVEGGFFKEKYTHMNNRLENFLTNCFYKDGKYYIHFHTAMQIIWLGTIFFAVFAAKCSDVKVCVLMLSIIGLTLFVLIFEARARYLFSYVPIYILLALIGIQELIDWLNNNELSCLYRRKNEQ